MTWYLEGFDNNSGKILRVTLAALPFSVGRSSSCDLSLSSPMVSQAHAEFVSRGSDLCLRDHGSTNGTFVNGRRLENELVLQAGDIVHFADLEFHLFAGSSEPISDTFYQTLRMGKGDVHGAMYRELREMLREGAVEVLFQPLVSFRDNSLLGYELLGRGVLDGTPTIPTDLFSMAENIGLAAELSALFRDTGMEEIKGLPDDVQIFVNAHPEELSHHEGLLSSFRTLRECHPHRAIVLEIHEAAVTDPTSLRGLSHQLNELDIGVAFDDFGTGQARILELCDAAPRYLKFDASLIRNLHRASRKRRDMVKALVHMALDMDIAPIAEGIEKNKEAEVCAELGFQYAQGYYFGRPIPARELTND